MGTRVRQCLIFFLLGIFLCAGSSVTEINFAGEARHAQEWNHEALSSSESNTKRDVITPLATVPVVNPSPMTPTITPPTTITPVVNPITPPAEPTIPSPSITTPTIGTPASTTTPPSTTTPTVGTPASTSGSWCVASQSASETALQVALDYACGFGGADCSAIQAGGSCFDPDTLRDHASYAFNNYYQKNPIPTSCNFGGTAVLTNIDPSSGSCTYQATSTTATVLNTTNPTGSTVYGAEPTGSTNSAAFVACNSLMVFTMECFLVSVLAVRWI